MTTLGQLTTRVKMILRDPSLNTDSPGWQREEVMRQLDDEITHLARRGLWGNIMIIQAEANRAFYPMNEQGLFVTTGRDNSGSLGNATMLTDTTQHFTTLTIPVGVNDRLRNLTDGSQGIVTTVTDTVLTCSAGFTGGVTNAVDTGALYLVERPVTSVMVVEIDCVMYDGIELEYATEETLDRRLGGGWELSQKPPKYWTVDSTLNPTVLRIVPPPRTTGSSIPVFPAAPFAQPWRQNLVVWFCEQPQSVTGEDAEAQVLDAFQDVLVYEAAAALAMEEGDYFDEAVGTVCKELANLWRKELGIQ